MTELTLCLCPSLLSLVPSPLLCLSPQHSSARSGSLSLSLSFSHSRSLIFSFSLSFSRSCSLLLSLSPVPDLSLPPQDSASCGGRSSNGSTSSLSTPPSVSQSPPQLNGVASGATGLMGALGAGPVGSLNGVIQTREGGLTPRVDVGPLNYRLGNPR